MKSRLLLISYYIFLSVFSSFAQEEAKLSVTTVSSNEIVIVIQNAFHKKYGVACPITYKFNIPQNSNNLLLMVKYNSSGIWRQIEEKTSSELFNSIEAVRFDYTNNAMYVSAAFSGNSDSLYLKMVDLNNNTVPIIYKGVSKYYDNRQAAVTVSFDDWEDWNAPRIPKLVHLFTSKGLYLTGAVITHFCSASTWQQIQNEVDSGYVEAASHSQTHPETPYANPKDEVSGSYNDILNNLKLPSPFSSAGKEYVYTWIAPYGNYDTVVDSLLEISGYLVPRIYANNDTTSPRIYFYGDSIFSSWDINSNHFKPFFPTVELGAPSWGGGDTSLTSLNNLFDTIIQKGDVYHCMWHPQVLEPDINKSYLNSHINYISNHKNVWYVNLGILYLYHLIQMENSSGLTSGIAAANKVPASFELYQNYPNPFNPTTIIRFTIPENKNNVTLKIYDLLGREVATLLNKQIAPGNYQINFDGSNLSSGIYFYQLKAGNFVKSKKMILMK